MKDMIEFNCEECNFRVRTKKENVGKRGRCPNCKEVRIIPEPYEECIFINFEKDFEEFEEANKQRR